MAERLAKRLKISREDDDYLSGNIIEIELRNFMTFNHLKCKPGSCLNLVIGPNGSGKSSIVCAIALGLGGEPQLLGRASSIGAFVKRGESSGHIMISLKGTSNEGKITITRKIDTANKSEWMFNGKVVPKKEVTEHTQRFNIQVNNLTQFLPQDRVCEFAKLTPIQLLEETEKAVGDPRLPVQHRALVDKSKEMKRLETTAEKIGETLNQLKAVNAEQEKDVERVRQREDLLGKANSMKKKLPWLKYDMKKSEYVGAKDQENDAKMKLNEAARILNEAKEPIEKKKNVKAALDTECKNLHRLLDDNDKKRKELLENAVHLGVQVQGKYTEMEELRRQDESHQQRILKAKKDLAVAEQELANQPPYEPPRDKIERLASQILELGFSAKEKRIQKSERESLLAQKKGTLRQCQDKLGDMENANHKLLQALHGSGADRIFEAYSWLEAHRHELNKEVYGPVLLEVNVSNRVHAEYIEGQIPYYIWKSFITQDPRDRDFLVRNLKSFDVPILNYVEDTSRYKEAFQITEEMRALGIYSRLDQVFDAPNAVKEVLISQFGLENSYIGSKETDRRADEVSRLRIMDLWTPDNHYRWSTSRYGGHVSAIVESVGRSRLLLCSVDGGEIERLRCRKRELEENISDLDGSFKELVNELKALENEAAILEKDREGILSTVQLEKKKRRELENLVVQRKRKLESFEKEGDLNVTMSRLVDQVSNMNNRRFQCMIGIKNMLLKAVSARQGFAEKHMASIEQDAKIKELEANLKQQEKFALQASMHYEYCKKAVEDLRHQLLAAKKYAESVAMITPELEREFLEMPTTVEELEAAIQDNISQANSILFLNQNVLEEYELRMRKMQDYSSKLKAAEEERRRESAEIDSLKDSWLPTLRSLVSQINETFSRNFQEMAVAGEVSLDERGMDFDQYGILIKVKFRQTGLLQVLSSHHQSGGERSVSTILYLVSLQGLANCPFRVVDEINQGMDPINERKMFQQLVRAASQPNTPQSFLLTPKLLPDLEYSEACTILNIMNGPWIEPASKAWSSGECWGAVMGLVAGNS